VKNGERIQRLEALLARVRTRAAEPRRARLLAVVPAVAPAAVVEVDESDDEATRPPPPPAPKTEVDLAAEPEVQESPRVVGGSSSENDVGDKAFDSQERLVAAMPSASGLASEPEPPRVTAAAQPAPVEPPAPSAPEVEAVVVEDATIDQSLVDEAPASSRRPVGPGHEKRIEQIAFGAEEPRPPLHTPPPESGRLPAATPVDFDADVTGVREAPSSPPAHPAEAQAVVARGQTTVEPGEERDQRVSAPMSVVPTDWPTSPPPALASVPAPAAAPEPPAPPELVADATRAALAPNDSVAKVVGEAQRFAPKTFVALLDASLTL
jgi:hypothetical protein